MTKGVLTVCINFKAPSRRRYQRRLSKNVVEHKSKDVE